MDRVCGGDGAPSLWGKYRPGQIARMSTWGVVPDEEMTMASLTRISAVPDGASTVTYMNVLDPGNPDTPLWYDHDNEPDTFVRASRLW